MESAVETRKSARDRRSHRFEGGAGMAGKRNTPCEARAAQRATTFPPSILPKGFAEKNPRKRIKALDLWRVY